MVEFSPGIFTWSVLSEPHGYDFNGTLLLDKGGNLCIDPVEPDAETLDRLADEGVARIVLTNRNHARAANLVRERTGARVSIHPADAEYARGQGVEIDDALEVGQRIGPFDVIGVPGKSPGEIALFDSARHLLVVGDALIGNPPGQLSLLRDKVMDDPAQLRASVRALLELGADAFVLGDGVSISAGGRKQLERLIDSIDRAATRPS